MSPGKRMSENSLKNSEPEPLDDHEKNETSKDRSMNSDNLSSANNLEANHQSQADHLSPANNSDANSQSDLQESSTSRSQSNCQQLPGEKEKTGIIFEFPGISLIQNY